MVLTVLRFPSIVGPTADTPLTRFLRQPGAGLLGFDPRMQVIHEDDVVGALVHAIDVDVPGVFNVAADGSLPLSQLMALAGKLPSLSSTCSPIGAQMPDRQPMPVRRCLPLEPDYLRYSWVGDLAQMRESLATCRAIRRRRRCVNSPGNNA